MLPILTNAYILFITVTAAVIGINAILRTLPSTENTGSKVDFAKLPRTLKPFIIPPNILEIIGCTASKGSFNSDASGEIASLKILLNTLNILFAKLPIADIPLLIALKTVDITGIADSKPPTKNSPIGKNICVNLAPNPLRVSLIAPILVCVSFCNASTSVLAFISSPDILDISNPPFIASCNTLFLSLSKPRFNFCNLAMFCI